MYFQPQAHFRPLIGGDLQTLLPLPSARLFGLSVADAPMDEALGWLTARLESGTRTRVAFLNAHCVNVAAKDPEYRAALVSADAVLPDGSGVALAARLQGRRLHANLNGTDLIPQLCQRLSLAGRSVFLVGGRPGVAAAAAVALARDCHGLIIAGTQHGYFLPDEEAGVIAAINASGADVVLAAFGVPLQETWLERVTPRLDATLSFGVGGLFDFLSGRIPRAPRTLRRLGLEWTYRLYQEPRRMWRRYIMGNPAFIARAIGQAVSRDGGLLARIDLGAKRALDIVASGLGLLFLAPLFLAVIAAIRLTTPGAALLRQTRVGQNGKTFGLYKFRSMFIDADARRAELEAANQHGHDSVTFKMKRDPRITSVGRFLRKSSIDELPQLWNVLIGDMSLVGPRPPLPAEVARYRPSERRRLAAKPGLTCLWQVSGRADLAFERQVELDVEYLNTRNFFYDLVILLRTVPAVLTARGAY